MYQTSEAYRKAIVQGARTAIGYIADINGNILLGQEQLQKIDIEASANSGEDLLPGSCLCDKLKITALDPTGTVTSLNWAGKEIVPYLGVETADGAETIPMGVFIATEPKVTNDCLVEIEAQDRACKLEIQWTTEKEHWPMTLSQLVHRACEVAGLEWGSETFPNSDLLIEMGAAVETTARAIVSYAAQIAGSFARMGRDGRLRFQWYTKTGREIGPESATRQMVAQYTVPVFDQVRVLTEEGDLGMLYPEMIESTHPFQITDNPLLFALSTSSKEEQQTALKAIYDQVSQITYAPLELNCQGDPSFEPGDIITVRNRYGEEIGLPIMEQRISYTGGLSMVIKSLGSSSEKGVVQGPLTESVIALRKRANVLQRELDFTRSEIKEVSYAADAIVTEVNEITQRVDGLVLSSSRTGGANLLKGSSARLGLEEWQVDGAVVCDVSTEVYNDTAAGGCFILGLNGRLGQPVSAVAGKRYAWYCQYKLEEGASTAAYISHGSHRKELEATSKWTELTGSFVAETPEVLVEAMVEGGTLCIADWTITQGDVCTAWQQAQNEIDAGGVKITSKGIHITKEKDPFQATLDNQQVRFRNNDTGEDVAYFNKDAGRIRRLLALGEFTVRQPDSECGAMRIIPVDGGAFFVIND